MTSNGGFSASCKQVITLPDTIVPFDPCTIVFPTDEILYCANELINNKPYWESSSCNVISSEIINEDTLLVKQLVEDSKNVNQYNEFGISLLQVASHKGNYEFVDLLIENGADINYYTKDSQETALTFATSAGHTEIVKLLIHHGANINHKKSNGDTAIDIAQKFGHNSISILFNQEIDPKFFGTSGNWQMDALADLKRDNTVKMMRSFSRPTLTNEEISTPLEIISVYTLEAGLVHEDLMGKSFQSIKTKPMEPCTIAF